MYRIFAIFRKDARHLWLQIAVLVMLMALVAWLDPTYRGDKASYYDLLFSFALPLTCGLIVISVIHEEKLPGDRQYWLTRPYSRTELIAAKVLFMAVFINLPLLAHHICVYAALGIPPQNHIGALLWKQVFFTAFYILPAAGLAVITRTLGGTLVVLLLGGLALWIADTAFQFIAGRPLFLLQLPGRGATIVQALLLVAGVAVIVVLQYTKRRTAVASVLAAAITLAVTLCSVYGTAYGRQSRPVATGTIHLSLDSDPSRRSSMKPGGDPDRKTFDIPVRLNGVPDGLVLDRYLRVVVMAAGKRFLFASQGILHSAESRRAGLSFTVDSHLFERTVGQPVSLSGSFDLQVLDNPVVRPLPKGSTVVMPEIGACRDSLGPDGEVSFICYSPSPGAALMAGDLRNRKNWIVSPASVEGPIPTASGFQPVRKFVSLVSYRNWDQAAGLKLIAGRPRPPFRVEFDLSSISLRTYLVSGNK